MPIPNDPRRSLQWHLDNPNAALFDLNVFGAWNPAGGGPAYSGAGTRVVVIDDGFDYNHEDLAGNYNTGLDYDFDGLDLDPFGLSTDAHGTAVAGIIGAVGFNGVGGAGVAYETELVGYRTYGFISDAWLQDIRDAIHHAAVSAQGDVANISQGIANDAESEFGVGYNAVRFDEIETSINTAVTQGRGGLGMTIVKSAGNSRADNYDVNADDWTNDTRQVVVGAVDQNGFVSSYSSYGAALLVSAFGTPGQVETTDRTGGAGYNGTNYTSSFNGTSAAAPMVSGVVSLMYEANAGLGWRDVQSILAVSARQVGSEVGAGIAGSERYAWAFNAAGTWNGGGQHFSNDYGFGLVDATAAVRLAETWLLTGTPAATSGNEFTNTMDVLNATVVIPDGDAAGLVFSGTATFDDIVERVTVQVTFSTTYTGDIDIVLTSPDGTTSLLIDNAGGGNDFNGTWTFETQAFRGERAAGTWSVRVADTLGADILTVSDIVIRTFGAFTSDDRYVFTDEYFDYAGLFGHVTAINDTNGGIDTANAAAVTTNSVILLDGAVGSIDGVAVSFAGVEHAIGGDGYDRIVGNGGDNMLFGMRGNDTLNGGAGADTVRGGFGNDTVVDDDFVNFDVHSGDEGVDTIDYSRVTFADGLVTINLQSGTTQVSGGNSETITGFEHVRGSQGGESIIGSSAANYLAGNRGNDTLTGGTGTDTVRGNFGSDVVVDTDFVDFDVLSGDLGVDTIDYSQVTFADGVVTINLQLEITQVSGGNSETITGFENARGSQGGEAIIGTVAANNLSGNGGNDLLSGLDGRDTLSGGAGNDTCIGGLGADRLLGGSGDQDVFRFMSWTESSTAFGIDLIAAVAGVAFDGAGVAAGDRIDLSAIDANETVFGIQDFVLSTSGLIGTLQCIDMGTNTRILGFVNAAAGADLIIDIADGAVTAAAYTIHDFIF
jgi:subtilisin family serine protease